MIRFVKNNLGSPGLYGFVPPAAPYFNEREITGYSYNIDSAKHYLNRANISQQSIQFDIHITKEHKPIAEFICKQWQETLDIEVNVKIHDAGVLRQMANNGNAACFRASWLGDYPDAENYLSVFYGDNFTPNGPNKTHYHDTQFDALYNLSSKTQDNKTRSQIYQKMDQLIMNKAPLIVLFYDEVIQLTNKDVEGLPLNGMNVLKLENTKKSCN